MKSFKEALKGNQHKLDKNKNGKLDSHDFKLLRKEEEEVEEAAYTNPGLEKLAAAKKAAKQKMTKEEAIDEVAKATGDLKDACWKGYTAVGMKKKNGKMVPNCVPVKEEEELEEGMKQTLRKYVPGYAKRELEKKMDAQKYEPGDSTKKTVDKDVNYGRYKKLADKMKEEVELDEATPSKQQVKQGIGIARDKRYAGGNMTGAVKAMDKVNKGLAQHPAVKKELQKQNEQIEFSMTAEEFEQLDELSKSTLASYAKKSSNDARISGQIAKDFENKSSSYRKPEMKAGAARLAGEYKKRSWKREDGTMKAIDRLAKEEFEQIDEISKKTLGSYISKAAVDMTHRVGDAERKKALAGADYAHNISRGMSAKTADAGMKKDYEKAKPDTAKAVKRMRGIDKAVGRLAKEEVDLEEKMDMKKADMGDVIKDFEKSDAPQFAGKSKEKRRQMAIAAKLSADRQKNESMSFSAYMKLEETAEVEVIELDEMIGYSDFQSKIDAHKKAGHRVVDSKYSSDKAHYTVVDKEGTARKVIHTARGTQMQNLGNVKGDDSDESPKGEKEKRGRGRPKGSKSGASGPRIK